MNIVVDARTVTDHFPGIGRYTANLLRGLAASASGCHVLQLYSGIRLDHATLPPLPGIECISSPFSLSQHWTVPRALRNAKADLYHSPYYGMPLRPGVPAILTCHDLIPLIYREYFTAWQRNIYRTVNSLAFRRVRRIITVSECTRLDLLRMFRVDPEKVVAIHLGVSGRFFRQNREKIDRVRARYDLPEQYVLYVGTNKPHKNIAGLVAAWHCLGKRREKLVIAGHWDARYDEAKKAVLRLNLEKEVFFLGPVPEDDLPSLYSGAKIFVFPSKYEGFGLPVLEAMACGTAVACSNIPSFREITGSSAVMFAPDSVEEMSQGILELLENNDYRENMAVRGTERAARFTWNRTVLKTLTVYRDVLEESSYSNSTNTRSKRNGNPRQ